MSTEPDLSSGTAVVQVPSDLDTLAIVAEFPGVTPEQLFDYWTKPELMTKWWPEEAAIDAREGGGYHFAWPQMEWHLRGEYTTFHPGRLLAFTWHWDHEEAAEPETVQVLFEAQPGGGTAIALQHGPYDESLESQENRNGHLEGWKFFLGRLQALLTEEASQ
jgi:uncharacterized protein YndB with AHSA1/START domain